MNSQSLARRLCALAILVALILATAALANENVENRHVKRRIDAMSDARAAMETLGAMMSGTAAFDSARAWRARKVLVRFGDDIPRLFRRNRTDVLSRARPEIWPRWSTFKARAEAAEDAARALKVRNRDTLGRTLPALIDACLACHREFRKP